MEYFNKIVITTSVEDVFIRDGRQVVISNCKHHIEEGCLYITAELGDIDIVIPHGRYENIKINTSTGDGHIGLNDASIGQLSFISSTGDLYLEAECDYVSFNSPCGDLIRSDNGHRHQSSLKTKTIKTTVTNQTQDWRNGERYK